MALLCSLGVGACSLIAAEVAVTVEGQPLAANVRRVREAFQFLGAPFSADLQEKLQRAGEDSELLQGLLDSAVLLHVTINPETRVKVRRGAGNASIQQSGFTPKLVKVVNLSAVTKELQISSPQAGQVYAGMTKLSAERMQRVGLNETAPTDISKGRFLQVEQYVLPPMARNLSGLPLEYAIYLFYSAEAGKREATVTFDLGQGTEDLGFRGETHVLFDVRPAVPVTLRVHDFDGSPTTASFIFRDHLGHYFPPQAKRVAPDFYFQSQIYRRDGELVLLPPGQLKMEVGRGPEYRRKELELEISATGPTNITVSLERWIDPARLGFYSGDHHIHAAGCAHYTNPTEGVRPEDMFRQVAGEALNVGCVLTWGPCFEYQRNFFAPAVSELSEALCILKYDLEISGFGSQALGHVCLLDLKEQSYPGSEGTKSKGWPTWATPVLRWAKKQGAVTGYAHSGSGLEVNAEAATRRLFERFDENNDHLLTRDECLKALLPYRFSVLDSDQDQAVSETELALAHERAAAELPNLAIPQMNGVGAMEICVSVAEGVCDFISAMDTPRVAEWNMWYHILNCGYALKVSGETDFPCMSGERVGQGRVYVQLGDISKLDFSEWCKGLAAGRSYISDGFAHAVEFSVNGVSPGAAAVQLLAPGKVSVRARVAFAPEVPQAVAHGTLTPPGGRRYLGDTVTLHGPRSTQRTVGGKRAVEIIVNGKVVAEKVIDADGRVHPVEVEIPIEQSSWIAVRQFPQLHTNPVDVLMAGKPVRAARSDALWCVETIEQLWRNRASTIREEERTEARKTFEAAINTFRRIASEAEHD